MRSIAQLKNWSFTVIKQQQLQCQPHLRWHWRTCRHILVNHSFRHQPTQTCFKRPAQLWETFLSFSNRWFISVQFSSLLSLMCIQKKKYIKEFSNLALSHKNNSLEEIKTEKLESIQSARSLRLQFCSGAEGKKFNWRTDGKICIALQLPEHVHSYSAANSPCGGSLERSRWKQGGGWGQSGCRTAARCSWAAAPRPAGRRCQAETSSSCTGSWPWWPRSGWTHGSSAGWCERAVGKHKQKPTWGAGKCHKVKKREAESKAANHVLLLRCLGTVDLLFGAQSSTVF